MLAVVHGSAGSGTGGGGTGGSAAGTGGSGGPATDAGYAGEAEPPLVDPDANEACVEDPRPTSWSAGWHIASAEQHNPG